MKSNDFMVATWRLIKTAPANGAWNMAADEALLESIGVNRSLPVLRLYAWSPPCLSLGYAQPFSDVLHDKLAERGWHVVRRLTGGRAILHTDELTYSVIVSTHEPRLAGGILESYLRLSHALLKAVHDLGVPAQAMPQAPQAADTPKNQNPVCFQVPSNYEITFQGKKLLGSAQARKKEGILQHGTLPLHGDLSRILQVLNLDHDRQEVMDYAEVEKDLLDRATTMQAVRGIPISWEEAAAAFENAFTEILNIQFLPGSLTPEEQDRTQQLVNGKYTDESWTGRI
jgi:lipoate-protein ligase A